MSNENRKNKPVYFSKLDPHDLELLNHAEKVNPLTGKPQNFSKYVKKLIEEDMKSKQRGNGNVNNTSGLTIIDVHNDDDETYKLEVKDEDKEAMSSFL